MTLKYSHQLIVRPSAGIAHEFYVTVHVKGVGPTWKVIEFLTTIGAHPVIHDSNSALSFSRTGRIVDVGNKESLNTFSGTLQRLGP